MQLTDTQVDEITKALKNFTTEARDIQINDLVNRIYYKYGGDVWKFEQDMRSKFTLKWLSYKSVNPVLRYIENKIIDKINEKTYQPLEVDEIKALYKENFNRAANDLSKNLDMK